MTTFETAQVGDSVWRLDYGKWVTIDGVIKTDIYPIKIRTDHFTMDGVQQGGGNWRVLFWDEVKIVPPEKPLPKLEVDTKVLVWDDKEGIKLPRHFSHFEKDGKMATFTEGRTSWSKANVVVWNYWELAEEIKNDNI